MRSSIMASKIQAPATAKCPQCGNEAKWNGTRYVCHAKVVVETTVNSRGETTGTKTRDVHSYDGYSFTNDVGVCEGSSSGSFRSYPCDKSGKPEPATKDRYDYSTGEIIQEPNIQPSFYGDDRKSLEGKFYCGIHSPSRKAAKEAKKTKEENESRKAAVSSKEARIAREKKAVNDAATLLKSLVAFREPSDEAFAAIDLLTKKALDQITQSAYGSRW